LFLIGAEPTIEEEAVYNIVKAVLVRSTVVLEELQSYKGASKEIRDV